MAKIILDGGVVIEGTVEELMEFTAKFEENEETVEPLKVGDYVKVVDGGGNFTLGTIAKITEVDGSAVPYRLETLDGVTDWAKAKRIAKATDAEVAEAKLAEQFAKLGRKPNEFKKGDIVRGERVGNSDVKFIGEVEDTSEGTLIGVRAGDDRYHAVCKEKAELIATVESRVDEGARQ